MDFGLRADHDGEVCPKNGANKHFRLSTTDGFLIEVFEGEWTVEGDEDGSPQNKFQLRTTAALSHCSMITSSNRKNSSIFSYFCIIWDIFI